MGVHRILSSSHSSSLLWFSRSRRFLACYIDPNQNDLLGHCDRPSTERWVNSSRSVEAISHRNTFQHIAVRAQYISHEKEKTRYKNGQRPEWTLEINQLHVARLYTMVTRSRTNRQNHATQDLWSPTRYLVWPKMSLLLFNWENRQVSSLMHIGLHSVHHGRWLAPWIKRKVKERNA